MADFFFKTSVLLNKSTLNDPRVFEFFFFKFSAHGSNKRLEHSGSRLGTLKLQTLGESNNRMWRIDFTIVLRPSSDDFMLIIPAILQNSAVRCRKGDEDGFKFSITTPGRIFKYSFCKFLWACHAPDCRIWNKGVFTLLNCSIRPTPKELLCKHTPVEKSANWTDLYVWAWQTPLERQVEVNWSLIPNFNPGSVVTRNDLNGKLAGIK